MNQSITKTHLAFVDEAKKAFDDNSILETYRNFNDPFIALRMGADRDCVDVYEIGDHIANFVQQMDPCPKPRKAVMQFAHDMERQLLVNEHKDGWRNEHHEFLVNEMKKNLTKLIANLLNEDKDKYEITKRCVNIANFAMMIADNEGEHL